jgi:hypothetical protein
MKEINLHILPTEKPSRLHHYEFECWSLSKEPLNWRTASHIYITSDEEIKERDWTVWKNQIFRVDSKNAYSYTNNITLKYAVKYLKKIILTTDQDLIKEGVQAIPDEFLEWFVKNPSCKFVKVENTCLEMRICDCPMNEDCLKPGYKIIIPQEEPNKLNLDKLESKLDNALENETKESLTEWLNSKITKQETLDKAADNYSCKCSKIREPRFIALDAFVEGAKWQAERMYSEEDVVAFLDWSKSTNREKSEYELSCLLKGKHIDSQVLFNMWFEQFKKK